MAGDADGAPGSRRRKQRELTPLQRALALLVRREHSRKELTRKLAERGIESEAASAAVETSSIGAEKARNPTERDATRAKGVARLNIVKK